MSGTTSNTYATSLNAAQGLEDGANYMTKLGDGVTDANSQLTMTAMISQAGARFGQAVVLWLDQFQKAQQTLMQMSDMMRTTVQVTQTGDQHNQDLAAGMPSPI
jgi:hypothetical protein